ncbi:hypothetical protein U3516DRAFT_770246 [Neocallimastix sp. 'constans']
MPFKTEYKIKLEKINELFLHNTSTHNRYCSHSSHHHNKNDNKNKTLILKKEPIISTSISFSDGNFFNSLLLNGEIPSYLFQMKMVPSFNLTPPPTFSQFLSLFLIKMKIDEQKKIYSILNIDNNDDIDNDNDNDGDSFELPHKLKPIFNNLINLKKILNE